MKSENVSSYFTFVPMGKRALNYARFSESYPSHKMRPHIHSMYGETTYSLGSTFYTFRLSWTIVKKLQIIANKSV